MANKKNRMAVMPIPQLVLKISIPLMISMLVQSLYNIVDGIFVSRISEDALTATSLAYPAQMLMLAFAVGIGVGINSLLSRRLGQKDFVGVNKAASNGLFMSIMGALLFMVCGIFFTVPFITLFTDDKEIITLSVQYLRICLVGCLGIFLATTGERLLQSTGNTFLSMLSQLAGAIANIILDPIFIFGLAGMPALGIKGAAIATITGQFIAAITALSLNKIKNKEIHFNLKSFKPEGEYIINICKVGIPTMLMQTMGSIMMIGMNAILVSFGSVAVAMFGVYYKLYTFVYMPVSGLAQGLLPIMGFNYGAKNGKRAKEAFLLTLKIAIGIMVFGTIIFIALPKQLLGMYDASEAMLSMGIPALRIISCSFPLAAVTITIGFACSALGNGIVSMIGTLIRQLILLVPIAFVFSHLFGFGTTWFAFWISETVAVIFAVIYFKKEYKKKIQPIL